MEISGPLTGIGVLITRPIIPATRTALRLIALGATPFVFPTVIIEPSEDLVSLRAALISLTDAYAIIFVSPSAVGVTCAIDIDIPPSVKVFVPGSGTAKELNLYGISNVQIPLESFDSEGLLKLPDLQSECVRGRRILIFRGNGGRELLYKELVKRGALVEIISAYHRRAPKGFSSELLELLITKKINAVSIMSSISAMNLVTQVSAPDFQRLLIPLPVYASHRRIKFITEGLGFRNVIETKPGDDGLISALLEVKS